MGSTVIDPSDIVVFLGIVIDDKLIFSQHVKKITNSAALKLNVLWRWLDPEVRLDYGRTCVLSSFQYCLLLWYFFSWANVLTVEHIQKHMLRMVMKAITLPMRIYYLKVI